MEFGRHPVWILFQLLMKVVTLYMFSPYNQDQCKALLLSPIPAAAAKAVKAAAAAAETVESAAAAQAVEAASAAETLEAAAVAEAVEVAAAAEAVEAAAASVAVASTVLYQPCFHPHSLH